MTMHLRPFDPAEYLDMPEAVAEYLAAAFETGDQAVIADALGVVAKARPGSPSGRAGCCPVLGLRTR